MLITKNDHRKDVMARRAKGENGYRVIELLIARSDCAEYVPSCVELGVPTSGTYTDNILVVTAPAAARNFKVVKAFLSETNDTTTRTGELYGAC